jgi:hypothetical protein
MLAISDARFIDGLVGEATRAGKLAKDFVVPAAWRRNTPQQLAAALAPFARRGLFDAFPFGTDFTPVELGLAGALQWLKRESGSRRGQLGLLWRALRSRSPRAHEVEALQRLGLDRPASWRERGLQRLVLAALRR